MISLKAFVLICTMAPGYEDSEQMCVMLNDTRGPHATMAACEARVKELADNRDVVSAATMSLMRNLNYRGGVSIRGGCVKDGISA